MSRTKVLFVCLGNICRSPAAEGIFKSIVASEGKLGEFEIDSAGTSGYHEGERADARMIKSALARGVELTSRSRKLISKDLTYFDYILVMDDSNFENTMLLDSANDNERKVCRMTDFASGKFLDFDHVPDPYFGGDDGFELVLDLLENSCQNFFEKIKK